MRRFLIALSLILLHPAVVSAQGRVPVALAYLQQVETRYGVLSVEPKGEAEVRGFLLDGKPIGGPKDIEAHIQVVMPMPQGGPADWVLVSLASGHKDCPMMFAFIVVNEAGATATDPFGTCSEVPVDLRETEATKVAMDMIGISDDAIKVHIYRFDGVTVDETVNLLP